MKKILLTLLAVLMFATAGTANLLAESTTPNKNDIYVSFGDSITRGLGSEPGVTTEKAEASDSNIRIVEGAYNTLVAEKYNFLQEKTKDGYYGDKYYKDGYRKITTNYYPVAGYGLTVEDVSNLLAGETVDLGWRGNNVFEKYGKGTTEDVAAAITGADNPLITLNLGLMDVTLYSSADETFQGEMAGIIEAANGNTEQALLSIIPAYEKAMFKAYLEWAINYDKLIGQLVDLRTKKHTTFPRWSKVNDYDMVLVGFFNPLRGVNYKISLGEGKGSIYLPIGNIFDPIVGLMNETSRFLAKKYNVKYADVYNGEGSAIADEIVINDLADFDEIEFAIHGTAETYAYMAKQIEKAIESESYTSYEAGENIYVDLVRYTEPVDINAGLVDKSGKPVIGGNTIEYSYSLDGNKVEDKLVNIDEDNTLVITNFGDTEHNHILVQVFVTEYGTKKADPAVELYTPTTLTGEKLDAAIEAKTVAEVGGKWVKATPTKVVDNEKTGHVGIIAVPDVTAAQVVDTETVKSVSVRTYVLMWRGDHYEALNIDSTNDRNARKERILSPITEPFKAEVAKVDAAIEKWYTDWYNALSFTPALEGFKDSVDAYEAAKEAIGTTETAIETAKAAVETAKIEEQYAKQELQKALRTPSWTYTEDVQEAKDAYEAAKATTKASKDAVTAAETAAKEAKKAVLPAAVDATKKGVEFAKSYSTWSYEFVTHIPDLFD